MKRFISLFFYLFPIVIFCQSATAQDSSVYNKNDVFDPTFLSRGATEFRSADGSPGPKYWQNSASYTIHATLDEKDTTLKGNVTINYTNNSPEELKYLWLQLDQNLFNSSSRGCCYDVGNR